MMILNHIYNIITANIENQNYFELRKEMIVKIFLHIANIILSLFAIVNFFIYHKDVIALVDTFAALVSLYAVFKLKQAKNLQIAIFISSMNLFVFFLIYTYLNQNSDNGLVWLIFLPIFIIPLNGHRRGLIISLIFYAIAFFIAYNGIGIWENGTWNFHAYIRFVLSSLVLVYIIYVTELAIFRTNTILNEKEKKEQAYIKKLQDLADKDHLTNIANRRKITAIIEKESARADRYELDLAVAIVDIDFFKKVNDTYGHNVGDSVLVVFAQILESSLRETDFVGRWGGEEFLILFTHTSLKDATKKCEDLCQLIRETNFPKAGHLTCSIGVSRYEKNISSIDTFINSADKALYQAKESGRDKVVVYK